MKVPSPNGLIHFFRSHQAGSSTGRNLPTAVGRACWRLPVPVCQRQLRLTRRIDTVAAGWVAPVNRDASMS